MTEQAIAIQKDLISPVKLVEDFLKTLLMKRNKSNFYRNLL